MLHWNTSSLIQKHKMMCTCSASQIVLLLLFEKYIIVLVYHLYNSCFRDITFLLWSSQILSDLLERLELPMVIWKPIIFKIFYLCIFINFNFHVLPGRLITLALLVTWSHLTDKLILTMTQFSLISLNVSMLSFLPKDELLLRRDSSTPVQNSLKGNQQKFLNLTHRF